MTHQPAVLGPTVIFGGFVLRRGVVPNDEFAILPMVLINIVSFCDMGLQFQDERAALIFGNTRNSEGICFINKQRYFSGQRMAAHDWMGNVGCLFFLFIR